MTTLLTTGEAAAALRVSLITIHRLIKSGALRAWRIGEKGSFRINAEDVEALKVPIQPDS